MAEVKAHFAPKRPPPKERMDPEIARRTLKNLEKPSPKLLSDYDREIVKSFVDPQKWSGSSSSAYQGKKQFHNWASGRTNRAPHSRCLAISLMFRRG
jgi:hypothetical protein